MGTRRYRTVVAVVLAGLCGMTCLEMHGIRLEAATEMGAPGPGEFLGEIVESGVVGCVLAQVVPCTDLSGWVGLARAGSWVWVGVEAIRFVGMLRP